MPLILAAFTYPNTSTKDLDLHQFPALSGGQVIHLVRGAVAHNATVYKRAAKDLKVLGVSFNPLLRPDDIARIVAVTTLDELIIWHNPGLSQEAVAQVTKGRIAKVTTRAGFLTPLKRFVEQGFRNRKRLVPYEPPPPILSPMPVRIRQVIWMMLGTTAVNPSRPLPDLAGQLAIPEGKLSLDALELDTLAVLLHPSCHRRIYGHDDQNKVHTQLVALPHHDAWVPLAEFYTSIIHFEKFMSNKQSIDRGYDLIQERWRGRWPFRC